MKNTLMCLLTALVLAVCLTACGGGGQTTGTADNYETAGQDGSGTNSPAGGTETYRGDSNNDGYDDGLMDGARDAIDDAGRSVRNAAEDAGDAIDRAF